MTKLTMVMVAIAALFSNPAIGLEQNITPEARDDFEYIYRWIAPRIEGAYCRTQRQMAHQGKTEEFIDWQCDNGAPPAEVEQHNLLKHMTSDTMDEMLKNVLMLHWICERHPDFHDGITPIPTCDVISMNMYEWYCGKTLDKDMYMQFCASEK